MIQENHEKQIRAVLALFLALLIILIIILAAVPPVSRDALVHHLAVPNLWIAHGAIYEMPDKVFSYYPMAVDLLYLIPLYFGNDIVPKFIHFTFALATSLLIFNYLKRRLDGNYGLLGALFFLSTPIVVKLSITAYVDLGLVFFSTAGLMYILKWREDIHRLNYLLLAALMGGLALGTKYNGLIIMLLLTLVVSLTASRSVAQGRQTALQAVFCLVLYGSVAALMYAPWGGKNFIWTGNPVYPLFDQWFNPSNPYETTAVPPIVLRKLLYGEKWWEIVLVPLRIFFQGVDDSPRYFDGKLNPALLILPLFAFIAGKDCKDGGQEKIEKMIMLTFAALFIFFVFFKTSMRIRYITPAVPFLVILSIFGLKNITSLPGRYLSKSPKQIIIGISLIIILLPFYINTLYVIQQFRIVKPIQYMSGHISRDQYIESFRPEYAVIKHANDSLPADASILSLFIGGRSYYSERKMTFDINLFKTIVKASSSMEKVREKMNDEGFSHLLVRYDMLGTWCDDYLNKTEKQIVNDLLNEFELLLLAKNGHGLYKL